MSDLYDNYVGTFDGRLAFGDAPALLIVDVVIAYLTPGSRLCDSAFAVALASSERLVATAGKRACR